MFSIRAVFTVLWLTMLTPIICFADNDSAEIADFLKHRNVLLSVEFDFASNKLTSKSIVSLDRVVEDLRALIGDAKIVRIEGFATPEGKEDYNIVLSMQRAMAVQEYLQAKYGLDLDLFFNGYGSGKAPAEKQVQLAFYDDTLGLAVADIGDVITQ